MKVKRNNKSITNASFGSIGPEDIFQLLLNKSKSWIDYLSIYNIL